MDHEALQVVFYFVIGLTALVILFAVIKIIFRNFPLWVYEKWPYLIGFGLAIYLFFQTGWLWAAVSAGIGLAMGIAWSSALDHALKKGREKSRLEKIHYTLVKWAQK